MSNQVKKEMNGFFKNLPTKYKFLFGFILMAPVVGILIAVMSGLLRSIGIIH